MPKSVLIYGINYAPEPIGVGRYTGDLGRYLVAKGHAVGIVTAPPHYPGWKVTPPYQAHAYRYETSDGAWMVRCPLFLREGARGIWRLAIPASFALTSSAVVVWCILRHRPDTVLCVEPTLLGAPAAILAARLTGARTVLHVQDLEIDAALAVGHLRSHGWTDRLARAFERHVIKRFDCIVTISEQMRRRLREKGVDRTRLELIRNWIDTTRIRPLAGPNPYRAELGLAPDDFVVLYSGNLGVKQALPVLLDAARSMVDDRGVVFLIGGDGPEKAGLGSRYGHLPNVLFLPLQPEGRLNEFLNLADLHVLPQSADAADLVLPSKLGGALASGRPVLATADRGTEMHEFLHGVADLVPAGDVEAVVGAIRDRAADRAYDPAPALRLAATLAAPLSLARFEAVLIGPTGLGQLAAEPAG